MKNQALPNDTAFRTWPVYVITPKSLALFPEFWLIIESVVSEKNFSDNPGQNILKL